MYFLRVKFTFYVADMIHDVITTANPFPYILINSHLSVLEITKLNKSDVER